MSSPDLRRSGDLSRRAVLTAGAGAASAVALAGSPAAAAAARPVRLHRWDGASFGGGTFSGMTLVSGRLRIGTPKWTWRYTDPFGSRTTRTYECASWYSPWASVGFGATEAVPHWRAGAPSGAFVQVLVRARTASGATTRWFSAARWASYWGGVTPTSVPGQSDAYATLATDTLRRVGTHTFTQLQVRVDLARPQGSTLAPEAWGAGVMASAVPTTTTTSTPISTGLGRRLAVPAYSQQLHRGHYPEWNGGGEAWCSATSTAMVLDFWGKGPSATESAWVRPTPHTNPQVDYTVRRVFDHAYDGAGNWPFNTAYAACRGLDAFVTRLRSLAEAQRFIAAGIPLVISTSFANGALTGAGYGTDGHLMVVTGFTADGQGVHVNDPASRLLASNSAVPNTYKRSELEAAWAHSGGLAYVIRPASVALPAPAVPTQPNW
ncbi:MAG: C39 family peptidase [Micrococcales bacterium]|nr:C39 family peptidase [Micrococcales bacterium]